MSTATVFPIDGIVMPPPVASGEDCANERVIAAKKSGAVEKARQYAVIRSAEARESACEHLKGIAALKTEAESVFEPMRKKAYDAYQEVLSKKKAQIEPLEAAEKLLKSAIANYDVEQRRLAEEAARLAREEEERRQAEMLEAQIEEAEQCGASVEEIHAIISQPVIVPAPAVFAAPAARTSGISSPREVWSAEVTNPKALIVAVAEGRVPMQAISINVAYLNQRARADKSALNIPGVRAVSSNTLSVRRK